MSLQKNLAEGGTSGATVTTANAGGASGTAPYAVNLGGGAITFDSAAALDGNLGYKIVTASGSDTNMIFNFPPARQGGTRITFRWPAYPSASMRFLALLNSSLTNYCAIAANGSGTLQIINNAGTVVGSSSGVFTANTIYELDLLMDNSAGSSAGTCAVQVCAHGSTTPISALGLSLTGQTFGGGQITYLAVGKTAGGTPTGTLHVDNIAWADGADTFIGLVNSTANAGADTTGNEPFSTVILDGSAASGSSYQWAFTSGTNGGTATVIGANQQVASFVAPATMAGTDLTFTLTVDGSATDTVVHSVLPHLEWRYNGSIWLPTLLTKY